MKPYFLLSVIVVSFSWTIFHSNAPEKILPEFDTNKLMYNSNKGNASADPLSDYKWTGTINLEMTERFNCNVEEKISELDKHEVPDNNLILIYYDLSYCNWCAAITNRNWPL